ncbi:MAG: hypothetical protein HZB24_06695 [Desulfobacterales bacterium]|nr:hypothetical protein [Desulfobacterales bacterium]
MLATGYVPDENLCDQIKTSGLPYLIIGDAKATRRLKDAIAEGYSAATAWVDTLFYPADPLRLFDIGLDKPGAE